MVDSTEVTPEELVQRSLDTYNDHDLASFLPLFADDVVIIDLLDGTEILRGLEAFRARYARAFAERPLIRADLVGRIVIGSVVVDHESVRATPDEPAEEALVIYAAGGGRIARMWFIEPPSQRRVSAPE